MRDALQSSCGTTAAHGTLVAAVRCAFQQPLVLPWAPPGFVIVYRVRITSGGVAQLLEPRKDTRTLAHTLLGSHAWVHVEFEALPERLQARERERRAQHRVLRDGLVICGVRFVFFGAKEGKSMEEGRCSV